jgi:plastocyanin
VLTLALSAAPSSAQSTTIDVGDFYFCDSSFQGAVCDTTVVAGSTVTWSLSGAALHTVTQCDASFTTCPPSGGFDSGALSSGNSFAQTFSTPGTIPYYCAFHAAQMRGRIVVQAQPTATQAATATPVAGSATPVPTTGSAGVPGATDAPAQVPPSGGPPADSASSAALALGVSLVLAGLVATAVALRLRAGPRRI